MGEARAPPAGTPRRTARGPSSRILGKEPVLRRVVAHREEQVVCHVGLIAQRLRTIDHLEQLHHPLPTVHPAPADLAFRGEPLAMTIGDVAGLAEDIRDPSCVLSGSLRPVAGTRRRVDPNHAIAPNPELPKLSADVARLAHLVRNCCAPPRCPWPSSAAGGRPHRRDQRADEENRLAILSRRRFRSSVDGIDAGVRIEQKEIDAVETGAVDFGGCGQVQHRIEIDEGSAPGLPLPTRPGHIALCSAGRENRASVPCCPSSSVGAQRAQGLRVRIGGSKMLQDDQRIALAGVLDANAGLAASALTKNSSCVISPNRISVGPPRDDRRMFPRLA